MRAVVSIWLGLLVALTWCTAQSIKVRKSLMQRAAAQKDFPSLRVLEVKKMNLAGSSIKGTAQFMINVSLT